VRRFAQSEFFAALDAECSGCRAAPVLGSGCAENPLRKWSVETQLNQGCMSPFWLYEKRVDFPHDAD
jgi:hypothetical protein